MAVLTTVLAANAALVAGEPVEQIPANMNYGKLRVLYDEYVKPSGDTFGTDGLIKMFKIPKGARLLDFEFSCPDSGTTGIVDIGWAASADGVEAADADGIIAALDINAAAVNRAKMPSTRPGYAKKFSSEVEVQVDFTQATTATTADTFKAMAIIAVE
jgi:hypothetical protein